MGDAESKRKKIFKKILWAVFAVVLGLAIFQAGLYYGGKSDIYRQIENGEARYLGKLLSKYAPADIALTDKDIDFNLFWEVWDALEQNYVDKDKLSDKNMFYGALHGLVNSVGDPYTVFMDPQIAKEFSEDLAGTFEGIGAEIGIKNDILTIIAPLPDMPAAKAGLLAGDQVYAIDGESTAGINVDAAVNKIRGPRGTAVVLSVMRDGQDAPKDFSITRDTIVVRSVNTEYREKDKIFVVKITNFNDDTLELFNQAVKEIIDRNPTGIILDLRNDPGGYLETAIEVASEWVEEGVIVTEKYNETKKNEHLARGRARLKNYRTVVLVNQGSASASEIVAGALQDYGLATIVGKKTFGKGSVQNLTMLEDGSSIKITVAKWLTPKERSINDEGIMPDTEIDLTADDFNANKDPQMDKALLILADYGGVAGPSATSTEEK
jgi:carboxyl-terminal processing protease